MGFLANTLYLGPFAEWRLRPGVMEKVAGDPLWEEVAERLWMAWTRQPPPAMTVRRVKYHRYCFCPQPSEWQHAPKGPIREFRLSGLRGIVDFRDIDVQAELDWLAAEFGPLLQRVGERLGSPAILQWGMVGLDND